MPESKSSLWRRVWRVVWGLRYLYLVLAILAATVWLLLPLGDTSEMPAPPLPSYTPAPADLQETLVLGPNSFTPGTQGATRVLVRDPRTGRPISDAGLRVSLAPPGQPDAGQSLYAGRTDEWGTAEVTFLVPEDVPGERALVIDVDGPLGAQRVVRRVLVAREVNLYASTDKVTYQPGEMVHFWALALGRVDGQPVTGQAVAFSLLDARGNQVCVPTAMTSVYGVAHASCELADRVNLGAYRLIAALDQARAARDLTVEVQGDDALAVAIGTGRDYYLAGERVEVTVRSADARGRPVAGATVEVRGSLGQGGPLAFAARGRTDERGAFSSAMELGPSASMVVPGSAENVFLYLAAEVVDEDGRAGRHEIALPVARRAMQIAVWPESGALVPGLENVVYLQVVGPDGWPVPCELGIAMSGLEDRIETRSDASGLARVDYLPSAGRSVSMTVSARDAGGRQERATFELPVEGGKRHLLLRADRESHATGDTVHVDALVPGASGAIYLDLLTGGQAIAVYAAPVLDGQAALDIVLPGGMAGVFELDAYVPFADGTVARDVRQVLVTPSRTIALSASPDQARYATGDTARVVFRIAEESGQGAFGLIAVAGEAPAAPHVEPDGPVTVSRGAVPVAGLSPEYAEVVSRRRPMPDSVRQELAVYERAWEARRQAFTALAERLVWAVVGLSALFCLVALADGGMRRSLLSAGLASALVLPLVLGGGALLAYLGSMVLGTGAVLALALAWFGLLVAILVYGGAHRDGWAYVVVALEMSALALGAGLRYVLVRGAAPVSSLAVAGLAALGGVLLALCVLGVRMLRRAEAGGALAVGGTALLLACTLTGVALDPAGERVPVYKQFPDVLPPIVVPEPVFAQPSSLVAASLQVPDPVTGAGIGWSGKTVYWDPEAHTDERGTLAIELPLGDVPASLQLSALAFSEDGREASAQATLVSESPLTVEPLLPAVLTVGDELDLPLRVRNTTPVTQSVTITVTESPWFRLRRWGYDVQQIDVPAGQVGELVLPIQVREWGDVSFEVVYSGDARRGVVSRPVTVRPNGQWIARAFSWWIGDWVRYKFRVPWSALRGTDRIAVKLYPGQWSVLDEAFERASRWEGASFDQVSAAIQARLLYAAYLRRLGRWQGPSRAELERALAFDRQRLLSFESPDGGFSAFGSGPGDIVLSAQALRCLSELAEYHPMDAAIERTALWLLGQQTEMGTWELDDAPATPSPSELPLTALVTWTLVDAGYGREGSVRAAVEHLGRYVDRAEDPYALALVVNALVASGEEAEATNAALARLADRAEVKDGLAFWHSQLQTLYGAAGGPSDAIGYRTPSVAVESTALATYALSRARVYPERVAQGLAMLTDSRDVHGTWNAPQTTVLALRALLAALPEGELPQDVPFGATVAVKVGEAAADPAVFRGDVSQQLVFDELAKGYSDVEIAVEGDEIAYQIVGSYTLPWSQVPLPSPEEEDLSIEVSYDRTSVAVGERLTATLGVRLNRPGVAPLVELRIGLPPGFILEAADLNALREEGTVAAYERGEGQIVIYLADLSAGEPVRLGYHLRARYPLAVWTQPTYAVDVANPQRPAVRPPVRIEVLPD